MVVVWNVRTRIHDERRHDQDEAGKGKHEAHEGRSGEKREGTKRTPARDKPGAPRYLLLARLREDFFLEDPVDEVDAKKMAAYTTTGAGATWASAIHAVAKGTSDTMNRCAKFTQIRRFVAFCTNRRRWW